MYPSDWSTPAALSIYCIQGNRGSFKRQMLAMAQVLAVYGVVCGFLFAPVYGLIHIGVLLPIGLLALYNGTRGTAGGRATKWLFYLYYPAHLLALGIVKMLCY